MPMLVRIASASAADRRAVVGIIVQFDMGRHLHRVCADGCFRTGIGFASREVRIALGKRGVIADAARIRTIIHTKKWFIQLDVADERTSAGWASNTGTVQETADIAGLQRLQRRRGRGRKSNIPQTVAQAVGREGQIGRAHV